MKKSNKIDSLNFNKNAVVELNVQQLADANSGLRFISIPFPWGTICTLSMHCPRPTTHALVAVQNTRK